jgi:hypothetical protein
MAVPGNALNGIASGQAAARTSRSRRPRQPIPEVAACSSLEVVESVVHAPGT